MNSLESGGTKSVQQPLSKPCDFIYRSWKFALLAEVIIRMKNSLSDVMEQHYHYHAYTESINNLNSIWTFLQTSSCVQINKLMLFKNDFQDCLNNECPRTLIIKHSPHQGRKDRTVWKDQISEVETFNASIRTTATVHASLRFRHPASKLCCDRLRCWKGIKACL